MKYTPAVPAVLPITLQKITVGVCEKWSNVAHSLEDWYEKILVGENGGERKIS
ncbi:MAG: hypothetical protein AB2693_16075 [Candidatus Thiodiazotropha sp.]